MEKISIADVVAAYQKSGLPATDAPLRELREMPGTNGGLHIEVMPQTNYHEQTVIKIRSIASDHEVTLVEIGGRPYILIDVGCWST